MSDPDTAELVFRLTTSGRIPTQDTIQQNQTMERFILPKSKEGIIASTREKARKRQALCRIKKRNEQSLIPTTSNHLEDTGNKQFASTSNHLENTENQEQVEHYCGPLNILCPYCNALNFISEKPSDGKFKNCCHKGRVLLPSLQYPDFLIDLLSNLDNHYYKNFSQNIRSYNSSLAFASMGAKNDNLLNKGPYCFRVHGQIYHRTSHLYPPNGVSPKYAQLNVLETSQAIENHVEKAEEMKARLENRPISKVNMIFRRDRANDRRRFNIPTIDEVAMIFNNDDGEPPFQRDVKVYPRNDDSNLVILNILSPNLDPMVYPLLFSYGDHGWHTDMKFNGPFNKGTRSNITMLQFKISRLAIRANIFNPILYAGRLFHQYVVDSYLQVEANNLNYIKFNQSKLRVEEYSGFMDHISKANDNTNLPLGRAVILPSSFQGSERNMCDRYHDAMAIVSKFGKPDLFITFTCNPNWREIKENLYKGQNPSHRPDLLARVFHLKLSELLHDIIKKDFFGKCSAYVYTIEFQKRGLPHAHLLIILSENNKIETTECIDNFVRAEIPDKNIEPRLYDIVTRFMIHGPCGILNPHSPCMENGSCTKKFPKDFQKESQHNANGYPFYQRRDKGFNHVGGKPVDNRYVIPYNKYLLLKFNAHINVEICTSIKSVKYIFKYVYKGYDCANIDLKTNSLQSHDEIRMHINARYVCACEAMWRLLENRMHDRSHGINRLAIHLPFHQPVYFIEGQERQALEKSAGRNTTLTVCANKWKPRQRQNNIISRMYTVDPKSGERFFLRLLLLHVVGATSFEYLRTVNGVLYNTFKEAAFKRNLLVDDKE
ncbi:uncharacterized protein LOC135930111 [Gordionus sp. m RMFG-2023]|uniref:uncharacterized protein LOC135930111 n=1 Tax=Gordionus sp. m RMFG-2023 TaxID=3053472 RepID=UPI0031FD0CA6